MYPKNLIKYEFNFDTLLVKKIYIIIQSYIITSLKLFKLFDSYHNYLKSHIKEKN